MPTRITIPFTEVSIALDSRPSLNPFGHIVGVAFVNGGPSLTIRLHDGTLLRLEREGNDWILGPAEGEDFNAVTKLPGYNNGLDETTLDMVNELWHTACALIDQVIAPIVTAAAPDLVRVLDRAMTDPPL